MNNDLQQMLGVAAIIFALCTGMGACSMGLGYGLAARIHAESSAKP